MTPRLAITRVINACVLLEIGDDVVLTDPYFAKHWYLRFREPIGLAVHQLPKLSAILGDHSVPDHWDPASLAAYPYKETTPVFVATRSMASKARAAGFTQVEVLTWGDRRRISRHLELEVAPAQTALGLRVNNYVLSATAAAPAPAPAASGPAASAASSGSGAAASGTSSGSGPAASAASSGSGSSATAASGFRVFYGSEARDLEPLRRYRAEQPPVDLALLPIDGARILGQKVVMDAREALDATRILGARVLVPVHFAVKPIPLLIQTPSSEEDLRRLAPGASDVRVVILKTGETWRWDTTNADARSIA